MAIQGIAGELLGLSDIISGKRKKEEAAMGITPTSPGADFLKAFQEPLQPLLQAERSDVIGHEYAQDPYRFDLVKRLSNTGYGRKQWGAIADNIDSTLKQIDEARQKIADQSYVQYKTPDGRRVPAPQVFNTSDNIANLPVGNVLKFDYPGDSDTVIELKRKEGGGYQYRELNKQTGQQTGSMPDVASSKDILSNPVITNIIKSEQKKAVQSTNAEPTPPSDREIDIDASRAEKMRLEEQVIAPLQEKLSQLRTQFNQAVPGRSELERLWDDYMKTHQLELGYAARAPRGGGEQDYGETNKKLFEAMIKDRQTNIDKMRDLPDDLKQSLHNMLRNLNTTLTPEAREDFGLAFRFADDFALKLGKIVNQEGVQGAIDKFKTDMQIKLNEVRAAKDDGTKAIKAYQWLLVNAPSYTQGNALDTIVNELSDTLMSETFEMSSLTINDLKTKDPYGSLNEWRENIRNVVKKYVEFKQDGEFEKITGDMKNLFNEAKRTLKESGIPINRYIPFFQKGIDPENIHDGIFEALVSPKILGRFALTTDEQLLNPNIQTSQQKAWIELFERTIGRKITPTDLKKIGTSTEAAMRSHLKKIADYNSNFAFMPIGFTQP